ncbi:MAG: asparagine synthase-related protein, partial [Gemmatimonadaceae bacterium]
DRRLVEFCLALPPEQKLNGGWTRVVLRRAMKGILPEGIQWRRGKADLSANFKRGLLHTDRNLVERLILDDGGILSGYVDSGSLRRAYDQLASPSGTGPGGSVWAAVTLWLWLRQVKSSIPTALNATAPECVSVRDYHGTTDASRGISEGTGAEQGGVKTPERITHKGERAMENQLNGVKAEKKAYDTPELTRLGDVAKITQEHSGIQPRDCPFGSQDDIKSGIGTCP